jgi:peptidoglycan/LPS O-acetylase OafA/YrhL
MMPAEIANQAPPPESKGRESLRYLIIFSPVLLLAIQSLFKSEITLAYENIGGGAAYLYWFIRAMLFMLFILFLYKLVPDNHFNSSSGSKSADAYGSIRNTKDPLLGLRAFACLCVFFGHWFLVVFAPISPAHTTAEYGIRVASSFSPWGGVWIFFTLSGYLMGKGFVTGRHNVSRNGLVKFYRNRILRIFPVYFSAILIVSALASPDYLDFRNWEAVGQFLDVLLFDQMGGGVIGALWSVSTEFQFYLLVPLIFLLLKFYFKPFRSLIFFTLIAVGIFGMAKLWILAKHPVLWHGKVYFPLLANLDCFMCGLVTSFIVNGLRDRNAYLKHGMQIGVAITALLYVLLSAWSYPEMVYFPGLPGSSSRIYFLSFAPGITAILAALAICSFEMAVRRESRPGIFWKTQTLFGTLTYCIYVWHEPIILSLRKLFPSSLSFRDSIVILPSGLIITISISLLFYYFIEKHYDRMRS